MLQGTHAYHFCIVFEDDKNITAWRIKDNQLQNRVKHKSGVTDWMTIQFLILPMKAKYSFRKISEE
jgi:hypothetical protein